MMIHDSRTRRATGSETKIGKVIAQAWLDRDYYQRLMREPEAVLREAGLQLEELLSGVSAMPVSPDGLTVCLPERPGSLSDTDLKTEGIQALVCINCRACGC